MNICFVSYLSINPLYGGIESVSYNLAREFRERGHNVIFVYAEQKGELLEACEPQFRIPFPGNIPREENASFVRGLLEKYDIDIIMNQGQHIHPIHDLCAKARKGTKAKLIIVFHNAPDCGLKVLADRFDYIRFENGGRWPSLGRIIKFGVRYSIWYYSLRRVFASEYRKQYEESDAEVLLSDGFRKKFISMARLRDTDKLYAIGNPVTPVALPSGPRKNQVVFVARMTYVHKRVDRMLEIWAEVWRHYPTWQLVMVGGGDEILTAQIRTYAEKLKLENIIFTGTAPSGPYYRESKILCLTSSYEGFGMVLIEAQQNGCVPIAYDSYEALGDIIENGDNGFKVRAFSKRQFVRKLRRLMDDDALRERMSARGLETVKKFDAGVIVEQWMELFEKLLKQ